MYKTIIFIIGILLVTSCQSKYANQLKNLDDLLETEAAFVLDSLKKMNVSHLNRAEKAYYDLLWVSATDKNMISQPQDSILTEAEKYYTEKKDIYNQVRVKYYIAKYTISKDNKEVGFDLLKQAELLLMDSKKKYFHLEALIHYQLARVQLQLANYNDAKSYGDKSLKNFMYAKDTISAVHSLKILSNISSYEKDHIQAKKYLQQALEFLNNYNNKYDRKVYEVKAGVLNSLSILCRNTSDFENALKYNQKCIEIFSRTGNEVFSEYYYTKLSILMRLGQNDSARYYCNQVIKAAKKEDKHINLLNGYRSLAKIEEQEHNYEKACQFKDSSNYYKDLYNKENKSIEFTKLEKEYDLMRQEKVTIESRYYNLRFYFVLSMLSFVILIGGSGYYIRNRDLKIKNAQLAEKVRHTEWRFTLTKELIVENNTAYDELERLLYRSKLNNFDSKLYEEFDSTMVRQRESYSKRLFSTLAELDKTFTNNLKSLCPKMPPEDFIMALMIRHGWKMGDIAAVFHVTSEAARKRKGRLEKKISQKLKKEIKLDCFLSNL